MSDMTVRAVLTADSKSWVNGFRQAEQAAKKTATVAQQSSTTAQNAAAKQASGMAAIRTGAMVAGTALVAFAALSVKAFNDAAMSAVKLQRVMGGSVEGASAYGQAAKLAGVDTATLERSLGLFDKKLGQANQTQASAAAMTEKLGTEFRDAAGNIKPLDQILPGLSDKFAAMENGPEKTALAMDLFGRNGKAMIPALNQGSAGIENLMNRARELGAVVDADGVAKFRAYKQATRESAMALEGLQMSAGSALLPTLTTLASTTTTVLGVFGKLPGPIKTTGVAVIALGTASMFLGPKLVAAANAAKVMYASTLAMGTAAKGGVAKLIALAVGSTAADGAMKGLAVSTGATVAPMTAANGASSRLATGLKLLGKATLVIAAVVALGQAANKLGAVSGAAAADTNKMVDSLSNLAAGSGDLNDFSNSYNQLSQVLSSGVALSVLGGQARSLSQMSNDANGASSGLRNFTLSAQDTMMSMVGMDSPLKHAQEGFSKIDAGLAQMVSSGKAEQAAQALEKLKSQIASEGGDVGAFTSGLTQYNSALEETSQAASEAAQEISRMKALMGLQTEVQFKQDMMNLNQSLKDSKGAFDNSKAGLANQSAALQIASGIANGYTAEVKRLEESGVSSADAANQAAAAYVAQGNTLAAAIPRNAAGKASIDALNQAMADVPGWVPINISAQGAEVTKAKLRDVASTANMTPSQKQIFVSEAGAATTAGKIRDLANRLNMTPKKLKVLLEAAGVEQVAAKGKDAGVKAGQQTKAGLDSQKGAVKASGTGLGGQVAAGAAQSVGQVKAAGVEVGRALGDGAVEGINSNLGAAISAAQSAGSQVAQAYKAAAEVHSPSAVTIYTGRMLNEGVIVGLRRNGAAAVAAARAQGESTGAAYSSAAQASAVATAKSWSDRDLSLRQEAMNKTKVKKRTKVGKKWKTKWVEGPSSGKGDAWRAGVDAAQQYADGIASAADQARQAAAQMRISTFDAMQSSAKGDFTQAKSASSLASWGAAQLKAITNFERNLSILADRGLPQSMLQQIISRGLDAAPLAASLAASSASQFSRIAAQGAAIDVASSNLANTATGLYYDRATTSGVQARQGASANSFKIYIGNQEINELVGVEVNGKVGQIVNRMAYS